MELRVLGPLEAVDGGRRLPLGGRRQRAVLALLLLHRNRPVSLDALVDALWGGRPPPTAAKTVQVYVSRLRKLLPPGRLVSGPGGYLLVVAEDELDVDRFERLVARADPAEPASALESLREALALFRGTPFAELDFEQAEAGRLEELRLTALERRIDAELALGGHAGVVGEVEALVAEHPLREAFCAQLMLALYRSGRQAEALAAYRRTRLRLVGELGIEPGHHLRQLEVRILNHDPALLPARTDPGEEERIRGLLERGRALVAAEMAGADELERARQAALALGDPEGAAEAEAWLGQLAWTRGDQSGCFAHLERARLLTEDRPPSTAKARVFDFLARRHMTAAAYDDAVRFGRAALSISTDLGDEEGRVESLNTLGTARAFAGDRTGIAELDEAIATARAHGLPLGVARASLNLAVVLEHYGEECSRIPDLEAEGALAADEAGDAPLVRAFGARAVVRAVSVGRWDEARSACDRFIAEAGQTPHYEERVPRLLRAAVAVGRGEAEEAIRDCRRAIQLCRAVRDPQALYVTLAWSAPILVDAGQRESGRRCAEEALRLWLESRQAYPPAAWIVGTALVLADAPALGEALAAARVSTRWLKSARAAVAGDWARAADLVATTGFQSVEAGLRLRGAEALRLAGRHAEALEQLERALAFYWRVGATLYVRRGETLMAVPA